MSGKELVLGQAENGIIVDTFICFNCLSNIFCNKQLHVHALFIIV